ncbi:DNA polymerase III subunit delta [bacterium]|nr:DNA polymerase III subunit delta [bacterium]
MAGAEATSPTKAGGKGPLLGAYLMLGTDEVKVRKSIERLDARLEKTGYAEFNRDRMKGSDVTDPSALRASLDTLPFGSDFRLVIVDDVDAAPKSVTEEIVSYLANPCPTTVLIMTAKKLAKNTRLYKATARLGDKAIVDCATLKRWRLPDRVVSLARDRGKVMSADAAELLVQLIGESMTMLDAEIGKLAVVTGDRGMITAQDVRENVARIAKVNQWDVVNAVSRRDAREAIRLMSLISPSDYLGLYTIILRRIREIITAKSLAERGTPGLGQALARELGQQDWQVKKLPEYARLFTMAELVDGLRTGCACEAALKSGADKTLTMQRWVLRLCSRDAA